MRRILRGDLPDALAWLLVSAILLCLIPIGWVSADGIGQGLSFAAGFHRWNPNHLLVEPLGVGWLDLFDPGSRGEVADSLKRLSILAGALAVGLFRFGVAGRLASSRLAANHGTAWMAFGSAFSRLWISDEIHMVQMPAVVLVAVLALRYLDRPSLARAVAVGASVALAAVFFLENLLLGLALAAGVLLVHRRRKDAFGILAATLLTAALVFGTVWAISGSSSGPLDWLTRYGGGGQPSRVESAYGVEPGWAGLAESTLRAGYGAACALVDLGPAVAAFRDELPVGPAVILSLLAFAVSFTLLAGFRGKDVRLLVIVWAAAVLAFGIFWNNSDDQFFVQLSVAFGALASRMPIRPALLALSLFTLLWNAADLTNRRILYPRQERLALLETGLEDAGLIVYPGFDEIEVLFQLEPPKARSISFTGLSVQYPEPEGMRVLTADIDKTLADGRPVALLDLFDTPRLRSPWKFLRRLGYEHDDVLETLGRYPGETRRLGPFTLRWVRPSVR
jgi:hypothetical protein